ncbi:type II toxin-antitoxin system CcdA family antitoxin [Xanthomonas oryzae pv. oryzae]|nr:type II toxin-antitoxin system CcdA family antitoxin [Xanthomonas oryzae]UWI58647.1 type II toxin-antitoxin system CcdA family antitoxin [Xanthomonas oryzae pv. oryzae]
MTGNVSAKVEALLAEYVTKERDSHSARALALQRAASEWKASTEAHGSFGDEVSTL